MKKIILDTNIYGELVKEQALLKIKEKIRSREDLIYGVDVIRRELRDTPKSILLLNRNLRISLLSLYDEFIGKHTIRLSEEMTKIAEKYYSVYKEFGGIRPANEIINDFYNDNVPESISDRHLLSAGKKIVKTHAAVSCP